MDDQDRLDEIAKRAARYGGLTREDHYRLAALDALSRSGKSVGGASMRGTYRGPEPDAARAVLLADRLMNMTVEEAKKILTPVVPAVDVTVGAGMSMDQGQAAEIVEQVLEAQRTGGMVSVPPGVSVGLGGSGGARGRFRPGVITTGYRPIEGNGGRARNLPPGVSVGPGAYRAARNETPIDELEADDEP